MRPAYIIAPHLVEKEDGNVAGEQSILHAELVRLGIPVPPGFLITAQAFLSFLSENNILEKIIQYLTQCKFSEKKSIAHTSNIIQQLIFQGKISGELSHEIFLNYKRLGSLFADTVVSLHFSDTTFHPSISSRMPIRKVLEDIKGEANLLLKIKDMWASLFTPDNIVERFSREFSVSDLLCAILVQKTIEPEVSGRIYSIDPKTNNKTKIIVTAMYGMENSQTLPDIYEFSKSTGMLLDKQLSVQHTQQIKRNMRVMQTNVPRHKRTYQKLSHADISYLATLGKHIEKHFYFPHRIHWIKKHGKIYILSLHHLTPQNNQSTSTPSTPNLNRELLCTGIPVSPGIATGPVTILQSVAESNTIHSGDILVISDANPFSVQLLKKAAGIITESGNHHSYSALFMRDYGIPAIMGIKNVTSRLSQGMIVTVHGGSGEIFRGSLTI